MKKWIFMLFAGLLIIGAAGYFAFPNPWQRYFFAHAGGLGILGLLALLTGIIAERKGFNFKLAFGLGFALPTLMGILAVLIVQLYGGRGCGGIVSLAASFLTISFYGLARKRNAG